MSDSYLGSNQVRVSVGVDWVRVRLTLSLTRTLNLTPYP